MMPPVSFDQVYREHRHRLLRWAENRYGDTYAEDIVQDAFLMLHCQWDDVVAEVQNIFGWMLRLVQRARWLQVQAASAQKRGGSVTLVPLNEEAEQRATPPTQEIGVYVEQLRRHFGALGPGQRDAAEALANGLTNDEYAAATGRTKSNVSATLGLARKRLREALGDDRPHILD